MAVSNSMTRNFSPTHQFGDITEESDEPTSAPPQDDSARLFVIYNQHIVDISHFAPHHPGGYRLLQWYKNKDITHAYHAYHSHSAISAEILKNMQLDNMARAYSRQFIDLNKPLVPQILELKCSKEEYFRQVHIPRFHNKMCRFFSQHYLEILTHTHWWTVPLYWGHIAAWFMLWSQSWDNLVYGVIFGILLWSAIEYCVHRLLFHAKSIVPSHPYFYTIHFLLHGVHHFLPTEKTRLVLPLAFSAPMAMIVWQIYKNTFSTGFVEPLFAGTILGYICYDVGHYFIHYGKVPLSYFKKVKKNHLEHHYRNPDLQFGVSSTLWDQLFDSGKK